MFNRFLLIAFFVGCVSSLYTQPADRSSQKIDPSLVLHAIKQVQACGHHLAATTVQQIPRDPRHTRKAAEKPLPFDHHVQPGGIKVDLGNGGSVLQAGTLLRGYELTGDSTLLRAGLAYADWLVVAQLPAGFWAQTYIVDPGGRTWVPWLDYVARIQDGHQTAAFEFLLYAYQLTRNEIYRAAALRNADVVLAIENANGSWPDEYDFSLSPFQGAWTSQRGVRVGGSYNDGATTNSAIQMLLAFSLTGDAKYLAKLGGLGQWIFDTRMGEGVIWGWCQQYDYFNRPVQARHFEMPAIEPRTFSRFVATHAAWFYALTGNPRYEQVLRNGHAWLTSVQTPNGWAYQYLPDGTPVCGWQFRFLRYDDPQSWPPDSVMGGHAEWRQYSQNKVSLTGSQQLLNILNTGGVDSLRTLIRGPRHLAVAYAAWQRDALQRATDSETVRKIRAPWMPGPDLTKSTLAAWSYLNFLFDVRVARGEISAPQLADRVSGFNRSFGTNQPDGAIWTAGLVHCDDWLALPIPNLR